MTQAAQQEVPSQSAWEAVNRRLKVVKLWLPIQLLVPSLLFVGASKSTRGASFYPGATGAVLGGTLFAASAALGLLLYGAVGVLGGVLPVWLLGSTGVVMMVSGVRPVAFVKPICMRCRLLPIITEHESIHLSGVASEDRVWRSMKTRHSEATLHMKGDPAICTFCPIPKRLEG